MDKQVVITLTALSGLAGALLTQMMTGMLAYINDRRKQRNELENQYRAKKLEIGENFYFINGELMTIMRKNIDYWQNLRHDRSERTLQLMKREMEKLDAQQARLHTENWKYNLIGIYFDVPFGFDEMQLANRRSHQLYIKVADLSHKITSASPGAEEELYKAYNPAVFDLISHYEDIYDLMNNNMKAVKACLLNEFGRSSA